MICRECGTTMYVDTMSIRFNGCFNRYWSCPNCQTSCIEEVRFSQKYRELWHSENNGVKDEVIKYKIRRETHNDP